MNVYVIELKPSKPTGSYMDKLASYFHSFNAVIPLMIEFNPWDDHVRFSTYEIRNKTCGMWMAVSNSPECILTKEIQYAMSSAKRYRFDLSPIGDSGCKKNHPIYSCDRANILSLVSYRKRWYDVEIYNVSEKITKDGTGKYLTIQFGEIVGDKFGHQWHIDIKFNNPDAIEAEIQQKELISIFKVVDCWDHKSTTNDLIGKSLAIRVDGDDIKGFFPLAVPDEPKEMPWD